jgi:formylmethanofuran dehydrogenase subunit D
LKAILISGRSLGHGLGLELGKFSETYYRSAAACEMNTEDMKKVGVGTGDFLRIATENGSVVVRAVEALEELPQGVIFIPYGPWINAVISPRTDGTGMPSYKGIEVEIEVAKGSEVLRAERLLAQQ